MPSISQGWSQDFTSTLEPHLEAYNISQTIYRNLSDQKYNAYMLLKELGWQAEVDQIEGHHFEEFRKRQTVLTAVGGPYTTGVPGGAVVVDIDPTMFVGGQTYIRENFTVIFADLKTAWVSNVNLGALQMTLVPFDNTYIISVAGAVALSTGPSAFGEGTSQPLGIVRGYPKRRFFTQILKENSSASGTAMTNRASVRIERLSDHIADLPSGLGNTLVAEGQGLMDFNMTVQISQMLLWSEENTNPGFGFIESTDPNAMGGTVVSTKGVNQAIDTLGSTQNYVIGALALTDFYDMGDILDAEMVDPLTPILWRRGRAQGVETEQMLVANVSTAFQSIYTKEQINDKIFNKKAGKEVFFNYKDITIGDYTYLASTDPTFTDPNGMGAAIYGVRDMGFLIPMKGGKDASSGKKLDAICIRYKKLGSYNRMFETWTTDWHQDSYDIKRWQLRCNLGVQLFGVNSWIKLVGN